MGGTPEFFTELAHLECNRIGVGFDLVEVKRNALERRFTHPMALIYHPDLDTFTGNILTHAKNIKSSVEIQTIPLADTDLVGNLRKQYVVASEFVQIPRVVLEEYIRAGKLKINFQPQDADVLNYILQNDLAIEFRKIAKNNFQKIQIGAQFMTEGYFDTNSPMLAKSPLKVSELEGKNMIIVHYSDTEESFIISEGLKKKLNTTKPAKKMVRVCGLTCTLI
jgi:hypothetical protein